MTLIKLASACLNQTPLDWEGNKKNILQAINQAKKENVGILCLPELCITGYGCEDAFFNKGLIETSFAVLEEIVPFTEGIVVAIGLPIFLEDDLYNTACLIANKEICGFVAKRYLASEGIYYEQRWFKPWPKDKTKLAAFGQKVYPIGDIFFNFSGIKIGFEICEDAWVKDRPGYKLAEFGVEIILNPSASHFALGKLEARKKLVVNGSKEFNSAYVYSNHLGNDSGRAIYDAGTIIASCGEIIQIGPRFSYQDVILTAAVVDLEEIRKKKKKMFVEDKDKEIKIDFKIKEVSEKEKFQPQENWELGDSIKEEEFTRAVSLGLFDYLRKSKSQGFVISLSGGADSSAVSSLVYLMLELGIKELGIKSLIEKVGIKNIAAKTAKELCHKLLLCIYQASENSGKITRNAAEKVANEIGAEFVELNISKIITEYQELVEKSIARKLTWETDDITLQNIQARVRAPSAWMFANLRNALLLVTSNRSEAAVGYATMDGDTAGSLMPIGGIDKAYLRTWLKWLETSGVEGRIKIPALKYVNEQEPTAELRPKGSKQTDEDDLMPYEFITAVEREAFLERLLPKQISEKLIKKFPQYSKNDINSWIKKFFTLWCKNQWKRERYAPSFHLDDQSSDPKTWCRFPILNSGFVKELSELE